MKLTEKQAKLVGLTMELDIKTREYTKLCKELTELKKIVNDKNDLRLANLYEKFNKNQKELNDIIFNLNKLKKED